MRYDRCGAHVDLQAFYTNPQSPVSLKAEPDLSHCSKILFFLYQASSIKIICICIVTCSPQTWEIMNNTQEFELFYSICCIFLTCFMIPKNCGITGQAGMKAVLWKVPELIDKNKNNTTNVAIVFRLLSLNCLETDTELILEIQNPPISIDRSQREVSKQTAWELLTYIGLVLSAYLLPNLKCLPNDL